MLIAQTDRVVKKARHGTAGMAFAAQPAADVLSLCSLDNGGYAFSPHIATGNAYLLH